MIMTQIEKELLIKDLCARIPYGVKYMDILNPDEYPSTLQSIDKCGLVMASDGFSLEIENVKPYLFPLSSMTEEQDKEYALLQTSAGNEGFLYAWNCANMTDWLNENHFDINGLISKGLAIDATVLNIY